MNNFFNYNLTKLKNYLIDLISEHPDFPKKGILFKDLLPILRNPPVFKKLIDEMSNSRILKNSDAIVAIDARGFLFGSAIAMNISKPMIVARKPGKLPGELISKSYDLEYGQNSLSIQKDAIEAFKSYAIVDDLLATGGTAKAVSEIILQKNKEVVGLSVVVELGDLMAKNKLNFEVNSQMII